MNDARPGVDLREAENEARLALELASRHTPGFLQSLNLVSESYLAQVLLALWDSGLYEYVRHHDRVEVQGAADELGLDATVLGWLTEYLVGRGLMKPDGDGFVLTDKGRPYWNYVTRGVLTSHLGGYNPLLTHLGPLLKKEIELYDPRLDRLGRLVALGAGYTLVGCGMVPWVLDALKDLGGKYVLDFGCGAGDFLVQLALQWPGGGGVGIDASAEAVAEAKKNAERHGVAGQAEFFHARLDAGPLAVRDEVLRKVDTLTAMFVLHEFGGQGGAPAIAQVIASLREHFPGRKLLMAEGTRADPVALCNSRPRSHGQLDYSFLHPLSRQGPLRTPDEWQQIIESAGARLIKRVPGFKLVPSWLSLYVIGLD